jgi:iron-sulfur cluster repair protein YtfE (RIC family)
VLVQHQSIREWLTHAERIAREAGDSEAQLRELQTLIRTFGARLEEHMVFEETLLFPVLATIDAWGELRVANLAADHIHQRAELAELESLAGSTDGAAFSLRVLTLVTDLRGDMEREEREALRPEVLRDDVVVIDQSAG